MARPRKAPDITLTLNNDGLSNKAFSGWLTQLGDGIVTETKNQYKTSFWSFLRDMVWTVDEARAGDVRRWPIGIGDDGRSWDDLWIEWEDALLKYSPLFVEKSRRIMASWVVCAFDLWVAAGGQDPRWPTLMHSDSNRLIVIQSRKLQDVQGSAWFIEQRCKFIYDQIEERGLRQLWPDFPQATWQFGSGYFSNGSQIQAAPQGAHQLRGIGATLLHAEEVAFWEQAQPSIEAMIPCTRGGGHVVCVTTAQVGSYAAHIRNGTLRHAPKGSHSMSRY